MAEFENGRWRPALEALRLVVEDAAAPLTDRVTAAIYQAAAWRELNQRARAIEALKRAAELAPDFKIDPLVFAPDVVAMAEDARAQVTGTLEVTSAQPGIPVDLDGQPAGMTPLTLRVMRGLHRLTLQLPGGQLACYTVDVQPGQRHEVKLESGATPATPPEEIAAPRSDRPARWDVWLPAAAGVALAGAGAALFVVGQLRADEIRAGAPSVPEQQGELPAAIRTVTLQQTSGVVLLSVGAAAVVTAVVLGIVGGRASTRISFAVGSSGAAVVLRGDLP